MTIYKVTDFGARGDGVSNDAAAIQKAIDTCSARGGGRVVVPSGKSFLIGAIALKSYVNLHIEANAALLSADRESDFPDGWVIGGRDAHQIAITGQGTIDGRATRFMTAEKPHIYVGCDWRPKTIVLLGCTGVQIRDITIRDAANWALTPTGCRNVVIHGISIISNLKVPNCDGIDPENCQNVRISDCHVEAGDDAICLKSSRDCLAYGPCENITVTGCTLMSTSCAIKIGSGVWTSVRDCVFSNCVIKGSHRGLGIQHRDAGSVENILFSNMVIETRLFHDDWWGRSEPIYVTALPREAGHPVGKVRNIRFHNILCRGESGIFVRGCPESRPENLVFSDVRVEISKTSKHAGGVYDGRPGVVGLYPHRTAGVYLREADGVALRDVEVAWGAGLPDYYGPALEAHAVTGLDLVRFRGQAAQAGEAAQVID